ncbi:MAG: hypothetical protein NC517_07425 [Firmicutes bacterium]|nr:hypothetical protein [Bacillota bacterium]
MKKKKVFNQKAVAMLMTLSLAFTFCWGLSVLKVDAYTTDVTKTWYYDTNTRSYKPANTQPATISLSSGASDRAHIGAAVTKPYAPFARVTVGQQFDYNTTKNFAYLNPDTAGDGYYIVGMRLTTDSLATSVRATYSFTP